MMTGAGIILGTAAYMSPEQARGTAVDRRADIWAFGVVVFEMVAGRRPFEGETTTDVIAAVVTREPDWIALPAGTPPGVTQALRVCLTKDPKQRVRDISAVRLAMEGAFDTIPARSATSEGSPERLALGRASGARGSRPSAVIAVAAAALVIGVVGALAWRGRDRGPLTPTYASLDAPADFVLGEDDGITSLPTHTPIVFTPDGRALVIQAARAGRPQLFLRALDRPDARPIAGTDDARVPFVSPDGKWVGFWTANEIRKVPTEGGAATTVCTLNAPLGPFGASWSTGDVIVFGDAASRRIMRVPAGGGTPAPVTAPPPTGRRHAAPFFLPDGKRILFSDVSTQDAGDSRLMVQSLDGGDARLVIASAVDGRLLPSGELVFMRLGTLMTAPFDPAHAAVKGDAVVAMGDVMQSALRARAGAEHTAAGMFAVSSLGTLASVRGSLIGSTGTVMVWATRDGRASSAEPATGAPVGARTQTRISPDGSRAIVMVTTPMRRGLWLLDWTRDAWTVCGDCNSQTSAFVWSPDGKRLLIGSDDTLIAHVLDGSAPDQVLVQEVGRQLMPSALLADGRIVYQSSPDQTNSEIKLLEPGGHVGRIVVALGVGTAPEVSPDGRWLAYDSTQTSAGEVMVQAFPGPGSRTQISTSGGANATWSADGRTLYYLRRTEARGSAVVAVDMAAASVLTAGKPHELFRHPTSQRCTVRCYDVSPDGQRFLLRDRTTAQRPSVTRMDLVLNWTATLPNAR